MLATDVSDCHITVTAPTGTDGVANILVALGNARIDVIRIEPSGGALRLYELTIRGHVVLAVTILETVGWTVVRADDG
jgi:hypothetical protein